MEDTGRAKRLTINIPGSYQLGEARMVCVASMCGGALLARGRLLLEHKPVS